MATCFARAAMCGGCRHRGLQPGGSHHLRVHRHRLYGMEHSYTRPWHSFLSGLVLKRNKKQEPPEDEGHPLFFFLQQAVPIQHSPLCETFLYIGIYIYVYA
ncbi:hypothetical protein V5799_022650 [Amblyomma americanum]|uniref:Uncharacterized protein n=1 Tax=Amblyomma americanum TaxID=6943 RepID=A0AAQ4FLB1_AMBAM